MGRVEGPRPFKGVLYYPTRKDLTFSSMSESRLYSFRSCFLVLRSGGLGSDPGISVRVRTGVEAVCKCLTCSLTYYSVPLLPRRPGLRPLLVLRPYTSLLLTLLPHVALLFALLPHVVFLWFYFSSAPEGCCQTHAGRPGLQVGPKGLPRDFRVSTRTVTGRRLSVPEMLCPDTHPSRPKGTSPFRQVVADTEFQ